MGWSRRELLAAGSALGVSACASTAGGGGSSSGTLYYLGPAKVFAIDAKGGAPRTLVDKSVENQTRRGLNDGIAIDHKAGHIYWSNMGRAAENDGFIMSADMDGGNVVEIVPPGGTFTPKQLKLDEASRKLYWSDREGMAVMRCDLDGKNIETIVRTGSPVTNKAEQERWCVGIAVDHERGQVYWTQKGGDNAGMGTIRRCGLNMPAGANAANRRDIETLFSRLPEPIDLDLDLRKRQIYWTDRGDNTINRAPMDGATGYDPATRLDKTVLHRGLKEAIGIALDLRRGVMAYTSLGGEVGVARIDGSGARMLATEQGTLTGIAWG